MPRGGRPSRARRNDPLGGSHAPPAGPRHRARTRPPYLPVAAKVRWDPSSAPLARTSPKGSMTTSFVEDRKYDPQPVVAALRRTPRPDRHRLRLGASLRLQRTMQFVLVRDHTGPVQVTHRRDGAPLEDLSTASPPSRLSGSPAGWRPTRSSTLGGLEIVPISVEVLNPAASAPADRRDTPAWTSASTGASWTSSPLGRPTAVRCADHRGAGHAGVRLRRRAPPRCTLRS